jgi:predicted CXXCH cytochrome family protein
VSIDRNLQSEGRIPEEGRIPKTDPGLATVRGHLDFVLRQSLAFGLQSLAFFRISGFGFRILIGCVSLLLAGGPLRADTIVNSKHNLAVSGTGDLKALTQTEICIFCHTPHVTAGEAPLWNHQMPVQYYTPYRSTTLKATDVAQPTGASKLCLSCHDGTVALGMVNSQTTPIVMQGGITTLPVRRTQLGTDLSDDHPISFRYDAALASANLQLKDPSTLNQRVRLDVNGQVQCTSCHDPHNNQFGKFLVQGNIGSALCLVCHNQNRWDESIHKVSTSLWNGQGPNPWPHTTGTTVAANGCENCHSPHQAGTRPRLLNFSLAEQNCYTCHDGNVAAKNIQTEFNKLSVHPILTTGALHDEAEDPLNPPRHVTCVDCHNPHAVQASPPNSPHAPGSLVGVKGITALGTLATPVSKESEICYRCHGDSTARGPAVVTRLISETNKRLQFSPVNASFHPVEAVGKNSYVPSLISPWNVSSLVACTDCHGNNDGPANGGTGPRGPHGSSFPPILERPQITTDYAPETPAAYALCYKCHSRDSILADQSFRAVNAAGLDRGHRFHIVDIKAACTTCHDSHGVANASVVNSSHLVNFNTLYVTNSANGRLEYVSTGTLSGNCSLTCHGPNVAAPPFDHNASTYPNPTPFRQKPKRR